MAGSAQRGATSPRKVVDDPDDPALADYVNLRGPEFRRVWERRRGVFVAEGDKVVARVLATPSLTVRSVLVAADRAERILGRLPAAAVAGAVPVLVASQAVIDRVTGFNLHRGVLAAVDRPPGRHWRDVAAAGGGRLLVIEGVNDQENLGSLFRSAAALGCGGLLLSPGTCDPWYRRTVRVSMGAVFDLPFAVASPWPGALQRLREAGWEVVALTPGAQAVDLGSVGHRLAAAADVAVLVGSEGAGLTPAAVDAASVTARIPMWRGVDSLNVAVAAGVALHLVGPARHLPVAGSS
jgi:tRNA G18 (ribose-2'-O)-methylase SpoU